MRIDSRITELFERNRHQRLAFPKDVEPINSRGSVDPSPYTPWYPLLLPNFPLAKVLAEAIALDSLFVEHRPNDGHRGWMALTLHGINQNYTSVYQPTAPHEKPVYQWTDIAKHCPETVHYFQETFPAVRYERIRFMKVAAGGYILPHRDKEEPGFGPLAIPLNTPENCHYILDSFGLIPVVPGQGLLVDISHTHGVINLSDQHRYHLLIEKDCGLRFPEYRQMFLETAKWLQGGGSLNTLS